MRAQIERAVGVVLDPDYTPLTRAAADAALRLLDQLAHEPPHGVFIEPDGGLALVWSDERGRVAREIEVGPGGESDKVPR